MEASGENRERGVDVAVVLEHNLPVVTAALRGGDEAISPMAALLSARTSADAIEHATRLLVEQARAAGRTWQEIGELLAITRQAAQQRFGAPAADSERAPLIARAAEVVAQVRSADWEAVTADWDEPMRADLGVERLAEAWQRITASAGPLRTIGHGSLTRRGPYRIVDVPLIFEHGPMKARVVFAHDDRISGLFVLLPDAP